MTIDNACRASRGPDSLLASSFILCIFALVSCVRSGPVDLVALLLCRIGIDSLHSNPTS